MSKNINLDDFIKNAEELDGITEGFTLEQSINPEFLSKYSNFKSLDELLSGSSFNIQSIADFEAIPENEWDKYICDNTNFSTWDELQQTANAEYAAKRVIAHLSRKN